MRDIPAPEYHSGPEAGMDGHCSGGTNKKRRRILSSMDEGRKRVIGIMASILASLHMQTADDLFGHPSGSPRTDHLFDASIQWAERIMEKIDSRYLARNTK